MISTVSDSFKIRINKANLFFVVAMQRVSRYPLFLSAMLDHTAKGSEESDYLRGKKTDPSYEPPLNNISSA